MLQRLVAFALSQRLFVLLSVLLLVGAGAVLLPGLNLTSARLFAEGARTTFAGLAVDGLPERHRFTASFGVAEIGPTETIESLMRRADEALYVAKRAGRDRVRVSPPAIAESSGRKAS